MKVPPAPIGLEYLPFQVDGINFAVGRSGSLIADEMGLGKTVQAIGVANCTRPRRVLIVCPASLRTVWKTEWDKWCCYGARSHIAARWWPPGIESTDNAPMAVIASYDRLVVSGTPSIEWDLAIFDEAHYLKSPTTKRTKAVLGSRKSGTGVQARRKIFLTGTPIVNSLRDILPIVRVVAMKDLIEVRRMVAWEQTAELNRYLKSSFMIRRRKEDVLTELPAKRRQLVPLPSAQALTHERRVLHDMMSDMPHKDAVQKLARWRMSASQHIMEARHQTALAKVPDAVDHIYDLLDFNEKVVVFAHHKDVIEKIVAQMPEGTSVLVGETSPTQRAEAVARFQKHPRCRVFVGSLMAAGLGLTLTAASTVAFVELAWTPAAQQQAEDRLHRIGQHHPVLVQHLVVDGSIDSHMSRILIRKQAMMDSAVDGRTEDGERNIVDELVAERAA